MNAKQELLKGLTESQIVMVKECGDVNDLLQLAKDEGVELTEEQLDAVSGGNCDTQDPKSKDSTFLDEYKKQSFVNG